MSEARAMELPIALPKGWSAESDELFGVIITGVSNGHKGFVTVSESVRAFALGMNKVRRQPKLYSGRYWRKELYEEAVAALQAVLS